MNKACPEGFIDLIAQLGRKDRRYRNKHRHSRINVGGGVETVTARVQRREPTQGQNGQRKLYQKTGTEITWMLGVGT